MDQLSSQRLENFKMAVGTKFQLYNSLFTSLPFHRIEKTGILLSLFLNYCEESYKKGLSPVQIVDTYFGKYTFLEDKREQLDLLFRFVQYAERQVVLFDAVEDAALEEINDLGGAGTIKQLQTIISQEEKEAAFLKKIESFAITLVLTAHPTQFYPGSVLGIINDLSKALKKNDAVLINTYLQQLGKTPLFKKQKPTPYDEAVSLIWYLENIFYHAIGEVLTELKAGFPEIDFEKNPVIRMGFWPGGDRDGNPNVSAGITLKVAHALQASLIRCYYDDVKRLKRRLTFKGVDTIIADLEALLYQYNFLQTNGARLNREAILEPLYQIRQILIYQHNSLFLSLVDSFINKVHAFGTHFASLDIRQDSRAHEEVWEAIGEREAFFNDYTNMAEEKKIDFLSSIRLVVNSDDYDGLAGDTLKSIDTIRHIQEHNGGQGCHRYIISQCQSALNVMEVYALFLLRGWKRPEIHVDIVPLFETVEDLQNASRVMEVLYNHPAYLSHLKLRNRRQIIMVGFSDGTKDGGYLMANWSIYKAKSELTKLSREHGVSVVFFDGRGGPPARGGGKTHKFYSSIGKSIATDEIQLTVQGQTVSANFGIIKSAKFNIEQLLHAGIANDLFAEHDKPLQPGQEEVLQELAETSYQAYNDLKNHPEFLNYLSKVSPLKFYSETNISSRPAKRKATSGISLKDLRAIPFVGAWSQLKQNVPGYYGLGTALEKIEKNEKLPVLKHIYERSTYFRTLVENCEMAMKKSYFPLTEYLAKDEKFGSLWTLIVEEYERTQRYLQKLSGRTELMNNYPVDALSIQMRERIVLPLTTIQQYALNILRNQPPISEEDKQRFEKLVIRSSFGIINAGRNSV